MILLVNPWIHDFAAHDFWVKPVGLLQIGGLLKRMGFEVYLIDCMDRFHPAMVREGLVLNSDAAKGTGKFYSEEIPRPSVLGSIPRRYKRYGLRKEFFREEIRVLEDVDLILMTSGMTYWYPGVQEAIQEIRQVFGSTPVVLGGSYATLCPDHAMWHSGADHIVTGGSLKHIFEELAPLLGSRLDMDAIPESFTEYPGPDYGFYGLLEAAAVFSSRGCPHTCDFCAIHRLWPVYVERDPDMVAVEIMELDTRMGGGHIALYDDAFLFHGNTHAVPLLNKLIGHGFRGRIHVPNGIAPRYITGELSGLMKACGFGTLRISLETSVASIQQKFHRKVTNDEFRSAVSLLRGAGFSPSQIETYVLIGLPGQSMEDIYETLDFVRACEARAVLARYALVPFTRDFELVAESHPEYVSEPLYHNNTLAPFRYSGGDFWCFTKLEQYSRDLNRTLSK